MKVNNSQPFLSQTNFPRLWSIFQYFVGGINEKRKLCEIHLKEQDVILEIGCSTGIMADIFKKYKGINYTGIDIDKEVIEYAQHAFRENKNFQFMNVDLRDFKNISSKKFDYILFAGMLHHIDDNMAIELFNSAIDLIKPDGIIVIVDPLHPEITDSWLMHYFMKIDRGKYFRKENEMLTIISKLDRLNLDDILIKNIHATPLGFPVSGKFGVYLLKKK